MAELHRNGRDWFLDTTGVPDRRYVPVVHDPIMRLLSEKLGGGRRVWMTARVGGCWLITLSQDGAPAQSVYGPIHGNYNRTASFDKAISEAFRIVVSRQVPLKKKSRA